MALNSDHGYLGCTQSCIKITGSGLQSEIHDTLNAEFDVSDRNTATNFRMHGY